MKNLKKLISVIIAVIMIVGSFATVSAADYADVESTNSYYKAIQVLSGLGIAKGVTENEFSPKSDVTRAQMVTFICRAMGEEDIATGAAGANFTDVAANHWAAGYIAWGVNRGIINGMGDGTFAPEAPVKYQDAVVMIMRALGYDRIAQRAENGGYPTGYLKVASQRGVLNGAGYDSTKAATREIIAQLINNALTAPIVEVSTYGLNPEDDRYIIHDGNNGTAFKCLLTTTNKIWRLQVEVGETALTKTDYITEDGNKVDISKVKFLDNNKKAFDDLYTGVPTYVYAGETDLVELTGDTVEVYITFDEDLNDWIALAAVGSNATVKKDIANVVSVAVDKNDSSVYVIEYKENADDSSRNKKEIDVSKTATVYVNGAKSSKTVDGSGFATYLENASVITLSKNRTSPVYTSIFVTNYTTYNVVEEVNVEKERVVFANETVLRLDGEDRNPKQEKFFYNLYDANGVAMDLADVKEGDVFNILSPNDAAPKSADSLTIYVTSNTVEGSVEEKIDNDTFIIAGEEYDVLGDLKADSGKAEALAAGKAGLFFVTIDGKICAADAKSEISSNFAVVSFVNEPATGSVANKAYSLDLLTKDGVIETYKLAKKVKYNGVAGKDADVVATEVKTIFTTKTTATDKLITYKLNEDGEIKEIKTAADNKLDQTATFLKKTWDADIAEFGNLDASDAIILVVDEGEKVYNTDKSINDDYVSVVTFADLEHDEEYELTVYQTKEEADDDVVTFAIAKKAIADSYVNASLAVVAKRADAYANDTEIVKFTLVQNGGAKELVLADTPKGDYASADVGDVIQYKLNAKGEIVEIKLIANNNLDGAKFGLTSYAKDFTAEKVEKGTNKYGFGEGYIAKKADSKLYFSANLADEVKDGDKTGIAKFDAALTGIKVASGDNTYASIDLYEKGKKDSIVAIDYLDIEATTDVLEVAYAIYKIDEDGDILDIIIMQNFDTGLANK